MSYVELSRFWHAGKPDPELISIAMMTLYCDESDDGHTYALAGWLSVPSVWDRFAPAWRSMLRTIRMPDGSECESFHAAEIVGRDSISDSPFRGWTFKDEVDAFTKATDTVTDLSIGRLVYPIGCALELPASSTWITRDAIWNVLFVKLLMTIAETFPAQRDISLMFDEKPEVADVALTVYRESKKAIDRFNPGLLAASTIAFGNDKVHEPLQAADLLAYEFRKRVSDSRRTPDKPPRRSYQRIREARSGGVLCVFGPSVCSAPLPSDTDGQGWMIGLVRQSPTDHY